MIEERNVIRCISTVCPKFGKRTTLRFLSTGVKNIARLPLCAVFNNSTLKCLTGVASLTCTKHYCILAEIIQQATITSEHAWNELSLRIDKSVILNKLMFWLLMGIMWWRNWKPSICSVNTAPWKEDIIVINNYTVGCITVHKVIVHNIAGIYLYRVDNSFLTVSFVILAKKSFWLLNRSSDRHTRNYIF